MDPESSLYIMSALAHQRYTVTDGSFREIKHNTGPMKSHTGHSEKPSITLVHESSLNPVEYVIASNKPRSPVLNHTLGIPNTAAICCG